MNLVSDLFLGSSPSLCAPFWSQSGLLKCRDTVLQADPNAPLHPVSNSCEWQKPCREKACGAQLHNPTTELPPARGLLRRQNVRACSSPGLWPPLALWDTRLASLLARGPLLPKTPSHSHEPPDIPTHSPTINWTFTFFCPKLLGPLQYRALLCASPLSFYLPGALKD